MSRKSGKTNDDDDEGHPIPVLDYKILLARVAGTVAAGVTQAPTPSTESAEDVAEISVEIAKAILTKVGLRELT